MRRLTSFARGSVANRAFHPPSGPHSPVFLQKMFVFQDPARTERLCRALAAKAREAFGPIDMVASPALGGIVPGYETARWLGAKAIFVERENGVFKLRRGFSIAPGARVLMVEDIITTGLSSREALKALAEHPGTIVGAACLIDRSGGKADLGVRRVALATLDIPASSPTRCRQSLRRSRQSSRGAARPPARHDRKPSSQPEGEQSDDNVAARRQRGPRRDRAQRPRRRPSRSRARGAACDRSRRRRNHRDLREDRRHIHDDDMRRLKASIEKPLNFEMAATEAMLDIALSVRPHACCIVPEKRTERTTEGGLTWLAGLRR